MHTEDVSNMNVSPGTHIELAYSIPDETQVRDLTKVVIGIDPAVDMQGFGAYGKKPDGSFKYLVGGSITHGNDEQSSLDRISQIGSTCGLRFLLLRGTGHDGAAEPGATKPVISWKIENQMQTSYFGKAANRAASFATNNVLVAGACVAVHTFVSDLKEMVSATRKLSKKSIRYYGLDPEVDVALTGVKNRPQRKMLAMRCARSLLLKWGEKQAAELFVNDKNKKMWDAADALLTAVQDEVVKEPDYRAPPKRKRKAEGEPPAKRARKMKKEKTEPPGEVLRAKLDSMWDID